MKFNKILLTLLIILMTFAAVSAEEVDIQLLKQMAENSAENLTTYAYSRSGESMLVYANDSLQKEYDAYKSTEGRVDLMNQAGWWSSRITDEETGDILTREGYYINGSEYWKEGQNWTKFTVNDTASAIQAYNEIPGQVNLIRYSNMEIAGSEMIQGEDCYKLTGSPIESIYDGMIGLQLLAAYFPSPFPLPDALKNQTFDIGNTSLIDNSRITLTAWVSKNDSTLRRLDIDSSLNITPEILNITSADFSITSKINESTEYTDFGSPVQIELPEEAQTASSSRMMGADWRWALFGSIRP